MDSKISVKGKKIQKKRRLTKELASDGEGHSEYVPSTGDESDSHSYSGEPTSESEEIEPKLLTNINNRNVDNELTSRFNFDSGNEEYMYKSDKEDVDDITDEPDSQEKDDLSK